MSRLLFRLLLGCALAIAGMLAASGTSQASRSLSLTAGGAILMVSLGKLSMRTTFAGAPFVAATCNVTLHGSLSRTVPKRPGTAFGAIHQTSVNGCTAIGGGAANLDMSLIGGGWTLSYSTFTGSLPTPTGISAQLLGVRALMDVPISSSRCLVEGNVPMMFNFRGSAPNISGLVTLLRHQIPQRVALAGICTSGGEILGSFSLTPSQTLVLLN